MKYQTKWREKSADILEQCFPKLNQNNVSKPSANNRSGAILMLGLIDSLFNELSATLITEEYERGVKFAEGMAIHEGELKERTRIVEILKKQDTHLSVVEEDNRDYICLDEALLAITEQK